MSQMNSAAAYEELAKRIATELAYYFGVLTQRCDLRVAMPGRGTTNEVDVLWEGWIDSTEHRIVVECKHYGRKVDQGRLHTFRSVLDDIADDVPTTGVFVTTVGYQSGAQSLAETYGIVVLELRPPSPADLAGRVTQIVLSISARMEVVDDVHVEAHWVADRCDASDVLEAVVDEAVIVYSDGSEVSLREALTTGERSPLGSPPTPPHLVVRDFPGDTLLTLSGRPVVCVRRITATVGDSDSKATHTIGPGSDGIAHILRDAITGSTVWFEKEGRIRVLRD